MIILSPALKMSTTRAIFIWSGTVQCTIDKLTMCASGDEVKFIDCFIIDIRNVTTSSFTWLKLVCIAVICSYVVKFKKRIDWSIDWKFQIKKCLWDILDRFPLASFGLILEKNIDKFVCTNYWIRNFFPDCLLYMIDWSQSNLHVALILVLDPLSYFHRYMTFFPRILKNWFK